MTMYFDNGDFKLFVKIADTGSLTRGAEKSFLSLPAASHRLKNLEESLNLKLLVRSAQGVTLTEAGKTYLKHARQVLAQLDLLTSDLQEFGAGIKGQLRVLANTTAITEFLPDMVGTYLKDHPDVQIDLRERVSDEIVRSVRDGSSDIGVISGSVLTDKLQTLPLTSSRIVVIAPLGHEVLENSQLYFKELLQYEQVSLPEGSAIHTFLHQHAAALHLQMRVRVQVASYDAVCRMVESGVGVAVVPITVLQRLELHKRVGMCELVDFWALREFHVVARDFQALPRYSQDFVEALIEHLR